MQLQKEEKSNSKQPSCKKVCGPHCEKRYEIQSGGQEVTAEGKKI